MMRQLLAWCLGISGLSMASPANLLGSEATAQLVPDRSLGAESSIVTPGTVNALPADVIGGGAQRGSLLFHSFRDFNVGDSGRVYFGNPTGVGNIFTRVTGTTPSNILGTLGVNGSASLFLLNPNGILFGTNAQLDIRGSFFASSGDRVVFNDGFAFSASTPQAPPLLTISTPIGLQYGNNPGAIRSQGAILQVPNGQTLALVGGTVNLEGGELLAPGGRVELVGVAASGEVGLTQQGQELRVNVPDGVARAEIAIGNDAIVNVRSGDGGSIGIIARNFTSTGAGTRIRAGIAAGLGTVEAQAGDIDINATEAVNLDEMLITNDVTEGSTGNAGNINIITGTLSLTNGAVVGASTFGQGNAGNVTITAIDAVSFDGVSSDGFSSGVFSTVESGGIGQGGTVSITTGTLSLTNGGVLVAATFGQGNAGNVTITAIDAVSFDGVGSNGGSSNAFSAVGPGGIGQGGTVSINTGTLSLTNGAQVVAATFGQGNAGNITITASDAVSSDGVGSNGFSSGAFSTVESEGIGQGGTVSITTGTLSLTNGAQVGASAVGQGNAGDVTITAIDAVSFDGVGSNKSPSGAFSSVDVGAIGQGGTIAISTGRFSITNGAQLSASSQGQGVAGNLEGAVRQLRLDNGGSIQAQTASGQGGNITLQVPVLLLLRRGSFISTTAGTAQAGGDGGNITLNGNFIVAVPQENSNISANAFSGRGGNIRITTEGLFGIQPRTSTTTGLSSITASSQFGISGTIVLNTPDVDPSRGIVQLPTELQDTSGLIASTCPADEGDSFAITGRGGLPEDPRQPLMSDRVWLDDRSSAQTSIPTPQSTPTIVEAQGWIKHPDGSIRLVATHPSRMTQAIYSPFCAVQSK
ncbi:filamentous haemagglutinin outer membrane protein [Leptolyngbya sp. NIES-3755]|nr:filamentous haemagglutinin outer membrane protein [Leptolyngbya sp. NIES-3755]